MHFGDKVRTDDGTVYRYMGEDATLDLDEARRTTRTSATGSRSEPNLITDALAYAALSRSARCSTKDGLAGSADSYFGLIDHNDLRSEVRAYITGTPVAAGGVVAVGATEAATLRVRRQPRADVGGPGAVIVTNVVLSSARA